MVVLIVYVSGPVQSTGFENKYLLNPVRFIRYFSPLRLSTAC
jgi:hypothetical protein